MSRHADLCRQALEGGSGGPIFAPRWGGYLSRLEQKPADQILGSPQLLSNALLRAQKLFQLDAICLDLSPALLVPAEESARGSPTILHSIDFAETLITRGFAAVILESLKALARALPRTVGLIGILPSPYSLPLDPASIGNPAAAAQQFEWSLEVTLAMGRRYGELDALDGVIITETEAGKPAQLAARVGQLAPLLSLLSFYQLPTLLSLPGVSQPGLDCVRIMESGLQGLVTAGEIYPSRAVSGGCLKGWAISSSLLTQNTAVLSEGLQKAISHGTFFITTEGEIPPETEPSTLHEVRRLCRTFSNSKAS